MKGQNRDAGKGATAVLYVEQRQRQDEQIDPKTGEPEIVTYPIHVAHYLFNAEQCEGLPEQFFLKPGTGEVLAQPQAVLDAYLGHGGPQFQEVAGDRAYYRTDGSDTIVIPLKAQFKSPAEYYSAAFHEATHSTGAPTRLNRPGIASFDQFGSGLYAEEELVAEMGAPLLIAESGIDEPDVFQNSANYLASWLEQLQHDRSLIVSAASQAYKAVDLITQPTRQAEPTIAPLHIEYEPEPGA
jgi:antirestriction protein ArdC